MYIYGREVYVYIWLFSDGKQKTAMVEWSAHLRDQTFIFRLFVAGDEAVTPPKRTPTGDPVDDDEPDHRMGVKTCFRKPTLYWPAPTSAKHELQVFSRLLRRLAQRPPSVSPGDEKLPYPPLPAN